MDRNDFVAKQRTYLDEMFAFAPGENEARQRFEQLALDTYDCLSTGGNPPHSTFKIEPASYFNFVLQRWLHPLVPPSLLNRWQDWTHSYPFLLERNPRLALYDLMQWIGETNLFESWPYGWEDLIEDWVTSGNFEPIPFDDRMGVINLEFYGRLQSARKQSKGWFYWDNVTRRVVFAPEAEWQRVRAQKAAARQARRSGR
jgi:hypothetical protein